MKISTEYKEAITGILIIVCFLLFFTLVHSINQIKPKETSFKLYAMFNKVDGISEGSDVYLSGIAYGKVTGMELDPYYRVKITLSLKKKIELPMDTAAIIQTNGLIGNKYIELVPGGDDHFLKADGMIAYTQDVLLIDDLLARLVEFMRAKKGIASGLAEGVEKGVEL